MFKTVHILLAKSASKTVTIIYRTLKKKPTKSQLSFGCISEKKLLVRLNKMLNSTLEDNQGLDTISVYQEFLRDFVTKSKLNEHTYLLKKEKSNKRNFQTQGFDGNTVHWFSM